MKLHQLLCEESVTLAKVDILSDLIDSKTQEFYTGKVNVKNSVSISYSQLREIPVQFEKVGGSFYCYTNYLTSLKGCPREVGGDFFCNKNSLTSLEHAPEQVGSEFGCHTNKITSLEGIHKIIKKINGQFDIAFNPIKSGGIGLLLIEGITYINSELPAFKIIRKYLGQGKRGLLACQEELIEAGLEEYAKL